jgi:hypothetical protein
MKERNIFRLEVAVHYVSGVEIPNCRADIMKVSEIVFRGHFNL